MTWLPRTVFGGAAHPTCVGLALALAACGPKLVWHGKTPDRLHEIRVVDDHGQYVAVDGVRGPSFDAVAIGGLAFAPGHFAYAGRRGEAWYVVADGRERLAGDGVGELRYGGSQLAYVASRAGAWRVVVDGKGGEPFDAILAGTLQLDRGRVAYAGARGDGVHVVVDGVVGPAWDGVGSLIVGDGHVAYLGRRGEVAAVVVDSAIGASHDAIAELVLAPGHVGYLAQARDGWHAIVDGVEGPAWDLAKGLAFSADGAHVAYVGRRAQGDSTVVTDGVPGRSYTGVRPATLGFGPRDATPTYVARVGDKFGVVHDGAETLLFDDVRPPVWSADGSRWGYVGQRGRDWLAVIDGLPRAVERWASDPVFSADGRRVAYLVRRGPDTAVVVDGVEHRFDVALDGTLAFDPSGRHWGCVAGVRGERRFYIVVDGARRGELDVGEAIDAALRTRAAGDPLHANDRVLHDWVAAEVAR